MSLELADESDKLIILPAVAEENLTGIVPLVFANADISGDKCGQGSGSECQNPCKIPRKWVWSKM